ncbi:MAG: hypothetical protein HKN93_11845 [Acidimicrobiia bacterium]|nr:hypothetical protein [Acidimicrobiia bacterium]
MNPGLKVCVLGPIDVTRFGERLDHEIGGRNPKVTLGILALSANRAVPVAQLVDAVWGDDPPRTAIPTLQSVISRLRKVLGPETITRVDHSYQLNIECSQLDVTNFERLAGLVLDNVRLDPAMALQWADEAEALWRGPVLGDLHDEVFARPEVLRFDELKQAVDEARLEALVLLGKVDRAVPELYAEAAQNPHREHLWHLLVRALYLDGRRQEAQDAYARYAAALAETGLEPAVTLEQLAEKASV